MGGIGRGIDGLKNSNGPSVNIVKQTNPARSPAFLYHLDEFGSDEIAVDARFTGTPCIVYEENLGSPDEWDATAVIGTWDFDSTAIPDHTTGTGKCIDGTATVNGDVMSLADGCGIETVAVSGWVYLATWNDLLSHELYMYAWDGGLQGNEVQLSSYIDTVLIGEWQPFVVPFVDMGFTGSVGQLRFRVQSVGGAASAPNFYLDDIQLEASGGKQFFAQPFPGTWFCATKLKNTYTGIPDGFLDDGVTPILDPARFFNIAALTNGLSSIFTLNGIPIEALNVKTFGRYQEVPEVQGPNKVLDDGAVSDRVITVEHVIEWPLDAPLILKSETGDQSVISISDDLSGIGHYTITFGGWIEFK